MRTARRRGREKGGPLPPLLRGASWFALAFLASVALASVWPVRPPVWLLDYFTPLQLRRASALGRDAGLLFAAGGAVEVLALGWVARRALRRPSPGGGAAGSGRPAPGRPFRLRDALAWTALSLGLLDACRLPLAYLLGFRLAHAYGLSTATFGQWLGDWAKSAAVGLAAALPAVAAGWLLMRRSPRRWWIPAGCVLAALVAGATLLGPVLVEPLFFRFTPLPPGPLRSGVLALAGRAGVHLTQVYVMNASSRTTALNAYVAGLGGTTRLVLYDTLLRRASPGQVLLVVAHELGHWKLRHQLDGTLLGVGGVFVAAALLARVAAALGRSGALDGPADPRGVPSLLLALALLSILSLPVQQTVSRVLEARADAFAVRLTGDRQGYARLQAHLAAAGLVEPDPPAWIEWTTDGHPSPMHRIEAALDGR